MKFDLDSYKEISDSLMRNKRRSFLTGFGIFWGLFMLLFLIGGGNGLKDLLSKNFSGFATNTIIMGADQTSKPYKGFEEGRYWELEFNDVERLKHLFPELAIVTPQLSQWGAVAVNEGYTVNSNMLGAEADYQYVETPILKYGRYLNNVDIQQHRKVCVIGKQIYQSLFPEGGDPCGQFISVNSVYYQVIGVNYSSSNININGRSEECVTVPITVLRDILNTGDAVGMICMVGRDGVKMSDMEPRIRQAVYRKHTIAPDDDDALFMLNMEPIFKIIDNLFRGVNFLIWLVGIGTLLAGAIGVSNIMMVVVKERTIEIGIRRAIGATPFDILFQIVMEGIVLTLVAGLSAIVFSVFMLNALEVIAHHETVFQINFGTAIAAFFLLTILGMLAGIAPAYRAMHIKPVDAMRDE